MQSIPPKTERMKPMPPELRRRVECSLQESYDLEERELRCPYCGFFIQTLFSDCCGHFKAKCPKCKAETVFNSAYFRRMRHKKLRTRTKARPVR